MMMSISLIIIYPNFHHESTGKSITGLPGANICMWVTNKPINPLIEANLSAALVNCIFFEQALIKEELHMLEISLLELGVEHLLRLIGKILSIEKYVHLCTVKLDEHLSIVINDTIF